MITQKVNNWKMILIFLTVILSRGVLYAAPDWVPQEKRDAYDRVIESAKEYAAILKADPQIIDSQVKKKIKQKNGSYKKGIFLVSKVKRGTLITDVIIEIDQNEEIKNIRLKDGKVVVDYQSKTPATTKDKLLYGGIGGLSGALLTLLLVVLI
jgi:hypothetical protein